MYCQNHLLDAMEIVSSWDIPDEAFADAINAQAGLMAGISPEEIWEQSPDGFLSAYH